MNAFEIIKTVRLTEKGTRQSEKYNQYTVVADRLATKPQIRQAVQELFKVKVITRQHAECARQSPPQAHRSGRQGAGLEKSHRHVERRRQNCFDLIDNLKTRTARNFFRAVFLFCGLDNLCPFGSGKIFASSAVVNNSTWRGGGRRRNVDWT